MKSPTHAHGAWLVGALARLDADSREIILLADVMGLSRAEIAARLGLSPLALVHRLAIARLRLQFSDGCERAEP